MFVKIKGTGSCLPEKVLDNFEISQLVDTNDEWIQSRTGIKSRHIAREETAVSMVKIPQHKVTKFNKLFSGSFLKVFEQSDKIFVAAVS